jgi:PTS system nitrogen regulatory IIA component
LLPDLLIPERVKVPLASHSKDEVLRELVQLAMPSADAAALESVVHAVLEREKLLSTGIGSGIAIPHGRTNQVANLILAAGVAPVPIDFDALDGKPVSLFFLLLGPESTAGAHVRALGRISRAVRNEAVRDELTRSQNAGAFVGHLAAAEAS